MTASDFIALGLVLHISVINEIEHLPSKDKEWKTIQNGTSLIFITLYSALYAATIIGEKNGSLIDGSALLTSSIIFSAISTILSFSVFHRVSKVAKKMTEIIYAITGIGALLGISVAIWSFIDTRRKYYEEYKSRKKIND